MTQQQKGSISIHAQNIMPIIKRWLYSDKDIFVREMVSNGCDAITKEKMLHPDQECDYRVTVTLDKEAKEIRFADNGHRHDCRRSGKIHQSGGFLRRGRISEELRRGQQRRHHWSLRSWLLFRLYGGRQSHDRHSVRLRRGRTRSLDQ